MTDNQIKRLADAIHDRLAGQMATKDDIRDLKTT